MDVDVCLPALKRQSFSTLLFCTVVLKYIVRLSTSFPTKDDVTHKFSFFFLGL